MNDFLKMFAPTDTRYVCADQEAHKSQVAGVFNRREDFLPAADQSRSPVNGQTRQADEGGEIIANGADRWSGHLPTLARIVGQISGLCAGQKMSRRRRAVDFNQ